jgi:hypothetical protein
MKLLPESLSFTIHQNWTAGNPPQPAGPDTQHVTAMGDDGNVYKKYWDGRTWSAWENLGRP